MCKLTVLKPSLCYLHEAIVFVACKLLTVIINCLYIMLESTIIEPSSFYSGIDIINLI